jgi:hypothetical protein
LQKVFRGEDSIDGDAGAFVLAEVLLMVRAALKKK